MKFYSTNTEAFMWCKIKSLKAISGDSCAAKQRSVDKQCAQTRNMRGEQKALTSEMWSEIRMRER